MIGCLFFSQILNGSSGSHSRQSRFGRLYNQNDYMIFTRQCLNPEAVTYKFEFYHAPAGEKDGHVGAPVDDAQPFASAFLLPFVSNQSVGEDTAAVIDFKLKVVGQLQGFSLNAFIELTKQNLMCLINSWSMVHIWLV